ncbi:peptide chain release factor 2 [Patescibacteria group bacterium]|nr:peptide chain release factor 2 [Patescibacteria group bacterium]
MEELRQKIEELKIKIDKALSILSLDKKKKDLEELKIYMSAPDFWSDQDRARNISTKASFLENSIHDWQELSQAVDSLMSLVKDKDAASLIKDISSGFDDLEKKYIDLSDELYLSGKYDNFPAILTINAGAGGVDAQDWAAMLERMYFRLAEQKDWKTNILFRSAGAEAGVKSVTFKIDGPQTYGYIKNEAGVHRLVRLSPYDADHARHTSFAMVEVLPELSEVDFIINEDDLKIDTFRASGHGGQSVNKSDSAVRITHLPTGIVVSCQNERSQMQNKKQAMSHLRSKLQKYFEAEKDEEKKSLKGEYTEAAWGNQIRSYVLHPYKMVKDHRTGFESTDPDKVLDGDLMPFIKAKLESDVKI